MRRKNGRYRNDQGGLLAWKLYWKWLDFVNVVVLGSSVGLGVYRREEGEETVNIKQANAAQCISWQNVVLMWPNAILSILIEEGKYSGYVDGIFGFVLFSDHFSYINYFHPSYGLFSMNFRSLYEFLELLLIRIKTVKCYGYTEVYPAVCIRGWQWGQLTMSTAESAGPVNSRVDWSTGLKGVHMSVAVA
jgi:hypothetical protein